LIDIYWFRLDPPKSKKLAEKIAKTDYVRMGGARGVMKGAW